MKTIVFDLDGTLTESKEPLDDEMVALICKILKTNNVAIISGASWKQFQLQVVNRIDSDNLDRLILLPSSGGSMYRTWGKYGWVAVYQNKLHRKDINKIHNAIEDSKDELGLYKPDKIWGKQIEDREGQVTFSALGQNAPIKDKDQYDPDFKKRRPLFESIQNKLSNSYDVRMGGTTSIDISLRGINKKFGVDELMQRVHISKDEVIYIGSTIFKGGSDYAAVEMGLDHVQVKDHEDTKTWINKFLDGEVVFKKENIAL
jgi:phosphomannomutase